MRLAEAQSRELLRSHCVYATEACDCCGKILGHIRFTRRSEKGKWCSRLCRDGFDRKGHTCHGCGVSLNGKRKHARFCSDTCRKRLQVRDRSKNPETPIADKGLTDSISRSGYGDSLRTLSTEKRGTLASAALSPRAASGTNFTLHEPTRIARNARPRVSQHEASKEKAIVTPCVGASQRSRARNAGNNPRSSARKWPCLDHPRNRFQPNESVRVKCQNANDVS
jgi:hypothetical protein